MILILILILILLQETWKNVMLEEGKHKKNSSNAASHHALCIIGCWNP
jgi:hypothetical protein